MTEERMQVGGQRGAIADALCCVFMTGDQKDERDGHGSVVVRRQFISSKPENIFVVLCLYLLDGRNEVSLSNL
jgi:hypothetical protein